jgi:serine/threonine-protein kinase
VYRGAEDSAWLGEGISEEITDVLATTRGLRVIASAAAARHRDDRDPRRAGRALGADVIVDGAVHRSGNRVRLTARLLDVANGTQVWHGRYDGDVSDVLAMQETLSRRGAEALRVEVGAVAYGSALAAEAVQAYLRARTLLRRITGPGAVEAFELLERALAVEPRFAHAAAVHAVAVMRAWFVPYVSDRDWPEEGKKSLERALELAPDLAETHFARALHAMAIDAVERVPDAIGTAIAIAPTYGEAQHYLAQIECEAGRRQTGMRRLELVCDLDPTLDRAALDLARAHALDGNWAEHERLIDEVFARDGASSLPAVVVAMRCALWRGDRERVRELARRLAGGASTIGPLMAGIATAPDDPTAATQLVEHARALLQPKVHPRFATVSHQIFAETLAVLGDDDGCLAELEAAAAAVLVDIEWVDRCPLFAPYRATPRFAALRERVAERVNRLWFG